jgi:maleylpyruvate isomerase
MSAAILHSYFRSSTSYRARIALNLKGVSYEILPHHLRKKEQQAPEYLAVNPQGLVPALVLTDKPVLTQSLAIVEYLDETIPEPPFLPKGPEDRARVRALAHMIAIEIHPLNNLRVLRALRERFGADEAVIGDWFRHWVVETLLVFTTWRSFWRCATGWASPRSIRWWRAPFACCLLACF